eukprot:13359579-Alexandrium_andersonii.AAC.1
MCIRDRGCAPHPTAHLFTRLQDHEVSDAGRPEPRCGADARCSGAQDEDAARGYVRLQEEAARHR